MNAPNPSFIGLDQASGRDMIGLWSPPQPRRVISPLTAIRLAATLYGIEENELLSRRRADRFFHARALVAWTLRVIPSEPMSYPKIGRALGDRDHSDAIHLHRRAVQLRLADDTFSRCCDALLTYFRQMEKAHGSIPAFG